MWLFLSNSFVSIVADQDDPSKLLVRARLPADINATFPSAKVSVTPDADYKYRAFVKHKEVARVIADMLLSLDYTNFKDSVGEEEEERHAAYLDVWEIMRRLQK